MFPCQDHWFKLDRWPKWAIRANEHQPSVSGTMRKESTLPLSGTEGYHGGGAFSGQRRCEGKQNRKASWCHSLGPGASCPKATHSGLNASQYDLLALQLRLSSPGPGKCRQSIFDQFTLQAFRPAVHSKFNFLGYIGHAACIAPFLTSLFRDLL